MPETTAPEPIVSEPAAPATAEANEQSFTSSHTSNFPELLSQLGISLLVSTYQAGKVIVVREQEGALNTHFQGFMSPMGMAYQHSTGKLAIGTRHEVWELTNQRDVAPKLEPKNFHDAAFLPRRRHYSGDIRIHEIGWVGDEIWAVNTRFSCLCTFDRENSFTPRWRPPFITAYAPEDRCHLNGMAIVDGRPRYVTLLGEGDEAGDWRKNKVSGGGVMDVETNQILLRGLSMPHSPRVYASRFWFLESGFGTLSTADLQSGTKQTIARLPGFTRGLDFYGNLAFIGLSQVRETATFSGIPLVDELKERTCGVWVVDIRNGQTVAFLRFEGAVQEIFSVQVLPSILHPDIVVEPGETLDHSFVLPDEAFAQVPEKLRA